VKTGVAVKEGVPDADCSTPQALKALLEQASAIYFPDPARATAGIHFQKVLNALGLATPLAARLRTFPNGATAMRELAQAPEPNAVGCTQVTEILFAPGVRVTGLLPPPYELTTTYTAAVCSQATEAALAVHLIGALVAADAAQARKECGFA
jgi:molybdate transport system substrate-binding protein